MAVSWQLTHRGFYILYWKGTGLALTFDLWHCSPNIHSLSQGNPSIAGLLPNRQALLVLEKFIIVKKRQIVKLRLRR